MNQTHYVYQQSTLDFVTAAAQTCLLFEHADSIERGEFVEQTLRLLPLLYLRTRMLETTEQQLDEPLQHFVQEEDYNFVRIGIQHLLGSDDTYLSVLTENSRYTDEPCTSSIAEDLADIYQEIKNMAANFQMGQEIVMNDAIYECLNEFHEHWGQKLLNAMAALHAIHAQNDIE